MDNKITVGALEALLAAKIAAERGITVPELVDRLIQREAALVLAFGHPPDSTWIVQEPEAAHARA